MILPLPIADISEKLMKCAWSTLNICFLFPVGTDVNPTRFSS